MNIILSERRSIEKEIENLENPEKELQRIKKFYANLGADYSKNNWLAQLDEKISITNRGANSRLNQLRRAVKFSNTLEMAVTKQDKESINSLFMYEDDEEYAELIKSVKFYLGVTQVKKDISYIKKAYLDYFKLCIKVLYQSLSLFIYAEKIHNEISFTELNDGEIKLGDSVTKLYSEINYFLTKSMANCNRFRE